MREVIFYIINYYYQDFMNPLKSAISSLHSSGFYNIDKNIFNDVFIYKNIKLFNITFE